jgi:hypothetical protein
MIAILVHWLIRPGFEQDFEQRWRAMTVDAHAGLYREILTTLEKPEPASPSSDDRFHTFSVGDPFYTTYINIGLWGAGIGVRRELCVIVGRLFSFP